MTSNYKERRNQKILQKSLLKKSKEQNVEKDDLLKFIEEEFDKYNTIENYYNVLNRKQRRALGIKKYRNNENANNRLSKGFGSRKFNEKKFIKSQKEDFMKGFLNYEKTRSLPEDQKAV